MDFGASGSGPDGWVASDLDAKQNLYGSGFFKQLERPSPGDANEWRVLHGGSNKGSAKVAKLSDDSFSFASPKAPALLPQRSSSDSQHMLCFSNPSSLPNKSESQYQYPGLPCFGYAPSIYGDNAGPSSVGMNGASMQEMTMEGGRGPFTPSQWMELEQQAVIYKYINANIPVPSNLLIPIRKAFECASGFLPCNSLGWRGIHLGLSRNMDPEPHRCRRTDGKKWRCSKDAMVDQKYCERHMNRGRHRSRKPVEGVHPVPSGPIHTACNTVTTPNAAIPIKPGFPFGSVVLGSDPSYKSFNTSQSSVLSLSGDSSMKSFYMNNDNSFEKIQNQSTCFSSISSMDHQSKSIPFMVNSLPGPSSILSSGQNLGTLNDLVGRETEADQKFMNNWPAMGMGTLSPDPTHLSISAPMPSNDSKLLSLRFAPEPDEVQMNLGIPGTVYNEQVPKQTNWIPISWETSIGGPLAEVLHNANSSNSSGECKNSSVLNLMTEGWDNLSGTPMGSSSNGVLQKATFGSVSNSREHSISREQRT
ncbi:hypothetical protein SAY87_003102 [Trapa incisa]|uniref:Growth-regulating factor n=1 Tax=Trapa incisa TaxID=236973 RepID=A0AAN7KPY9_9MYRT|nr:hypothetical protein SAY87_003102 [Trapa incisa]